MYIPNSHKSMWCLFPITDLTPSVKVLIVKRKTVPDKSRVCAIGVRRCLFWFILMRWPHCNLTACVCVCVFAYIKMNKVIHLNPKMLLVHFHGKPNLMSTQLLSTLPHPLLWRSADWTNSYLLIHTKMWKTQKKKDRKIKKGKTTHRHKDI